MSYKCNNVRVQNTSTNSLTGARNLCGLGAQGDGIDAIEDGQQVALAGSRAGSKRFVSVLFLSFAHPFDPKLKLLKIHPNSSCKARVSLHYA